MTFRTLSGSLFLSLWIAACSGGEGGDGENPGEPDAAIDEVAACPAEAPDRLIVLGDSIAACFGVDGVDADGKDSDGCSSLLLQRYMDANLSPGISYENKAVSGSTTSQLVSGQLSTASTGGGHAFVLIYIGGNDLRPLLGASDSQAQAAYDSMMPGIKADWEAIFDHFDDTEAFPNGVTVLMNNQYNPFDDCNEPGFGMTPLKTMLLGEYNAELQAIADEHPNAFLTDQHTSYLGHGHYNQVAACPHFEEGLDFWMYDLIHPNALGHGNLAVQWEKTVDTIFADCEL